MNSQRAKIKSWVPVYYVVYGVLWILLSDHLLATLVPNVPMFALFSTINGWLFVVATAVALYLFVLLEEKRKAHLELQYQDLFDASPDGIFVVNQYGKILNVNQKAIRQYGYSDKELVGMEILA